MFNESENHLGIESTLGDIILAAHGANSSTGNGAVSERMRVTSTLFTDPHWGSQPVSATRVSISSRPGHIITEPIAMLHMGDPWYYQLGGHRGWMNTGTYIQRFNDNVFFGIRPRESGGSDANDAIIAWGDNDSPPERMDALRIVFNAPYSGSADPGEPEHLNGLEIMRMHPQGNVGIGDFSVNGLNEMPTEKLDILGNARIRQISTNDTLDVLIAGIEQDTVGDYVLNYLSFPGNENLFLDGTGNWSAGVAGLVCRWFDIPSLTVPLETDLRIGYGLAADDCYRGKLAIGAIANKDSKVMIINKSERDRVSYGAIIHSYVSEFPSNLGVGTWSKSWGYTQVSNLQNLYIGVLAQGGGGDATSGKHNVGVYSAGLANSEGFSFGTYATANGGQQNNNIALYGEADIALYTVGTEVNTTIPINISDQSIKSDIQDLSDASEILSNLQPRTYYYQNPEIRDLHLDEELQFGFIAQEVEEVLPEIVKDVHLPEKIDTTGAVPGTAMDLKGIQYTALIPILVAGFQEQQTQIAARETQLNALQEH